MSRVKSDNALLGVLTGHYARWVHTKGNTTINAKAGTPLVLQRVVINTTAAGDITLTDSGDATHGAEVIADIKASVLEGAIEYHLPLRGNLVVTNAGGSDITIVFSNN
jgi:hypothetical protein